MRAALLVAVLASALGFAATQTHGSHGGGGRADMGPWLALSLAEPYDGAWLEFAPTLDGGSLGLDNAPASFCEVLAADERVGNWACFEGDGGSLNAGFTASASFATNAHTYCPNGPNCGTRSSVQSSFVGTKTKWTTGAVARTTANMTICASTLTNHGGLETPIATWATNSSGEGLGLSLGMNTSTTCYAYYTRVAAGACGISTITATAASTEGAVAVCCVRISGNNTVDIFANGTKGTPVTGLSDAGCSDQAKIFAVNAWGSAGASQSGDWLGAFWTEAAVSDARIAALSHQLLVDQPRAISGDGDAGIYLVMTRTTARACPKDATHSQMSILPAGATCVSNGGLYTEGGGQNVVPRAEEFSNAAWASFVDGGAAAAVVVANQAYGPAPKFTADRITFGATDGTQISGLSQSVLTAAAYSGQVWLMGQAGDAGTIDLMLEGTGNAPVCTPCSFVSGSYTRCKKENVTAMASGRYALGNLGAICDGGTRAAADVLVWGAHAETGAVVSSYAPTTNAAFTRNAETVAYGIPTIELKTQGSTAGTLVVERATPGGAVAFFGNNARALYFASGANVLQYEGVTTNARAHGLGAGSVDRIAGDWNTDGGMNIYSSDGGRTGAAFAGNMTNGATDAGNFANSGVVLGTYGWLKNVCISPDPTRCR